MKKHSFLFTLLIALFFNLTGCEAANSKTDEETSINNRPEIDIRKMKLKVTIDNLVLTATLVDNPTTRDFISLLPLTVKLDDYVSSEKIFYPEKKLSTKTTGSIEAVAGDITYYYPWGNVAIFYKDFGKSSSLIRIAKFDGSIDVFKDKNSLNNVKFELYEAE